MSCLSNPKRDILYRVAFRAKRVRLGVALISELIRKPSQKRDARILTVCIVEDLKDKRSRVKAIESPGRIRKIIREARLIHRIPLVDLNRNFLILNNGRDKRMIETAPSIIARFSKMRASAANQPAIFPRRLPRTSDIRTCLYVMRLILICAAVYGE